MIFFAVGDQAFRRFKRRFPSDIGYDRVDRSDSTDPENLGIVFQVFQELLAKGAGASDIYDGIFFPCDTYTVV